MENEKAITPGHEFGNLSGGNGDHLGSSPVRGAVARSLGFNMKNLPEPFQGGDVFRDIIAIHEVIGVCVKEGNRLVPKDNCHIVFPRQDPQGDPEGLIRAVSYFRVGGNQDENRSAHELS